LIIQEGFALALQICMCHALIKLTTPLLILSLSLCSSNIQQLTVHNLYYIHIQMSSFQYFSFCSIFLSTSASCCPLRQTH
jgi:hypothetical protein